MSVWKVGGKFALLKEVWQKGGNFQGFTEAVMCTQQVIDESVGATQQSEAERIFERLGPLFEEERMRIAQLLASKADRELFGQTEYELRDRVHHLGAKSLEAAADERQKKGRIRGC
ncbi:MAG: hypothetical protein IT427_04455 [Pirellulales bacterium]|nr:hypothetical protein [Pirellulales bacterium]